MKTYYGYWDNGSSYNREPYKDTNLARLRKTMRAIAEGNDAGSGGWWSIQDEDTERGDQYPVATGGSK